MKTLRKIFTAVMVIGFCMTIMAGCTVNKTDSTANSTVGKSTEAAKGTSTDSSAKDSPSKDSADNNSGSSGKVIKEGTIEKDGNVVLKELAFVYNGKTIAISDIVDDEKLEGIFGKAKDIKSHTYSNNDGRNMDTLIGLTEKQFKFEGLEIKTINAAEGKKFFIFNIKITDSKYSTVRNIKVGDSVEKLKEAYPEGKMLGDGAGREDDFLYQPVNYVDSMNFHIKDNKIESIRLSTLLD